FFSSRRRHTRWPRDWSSDVCSSDLFAGEVSIADVSALAFLAAYAIARLGLERQLVPKTVATLTLFLALFVVVYLCGFFNLATDRSEERRVGKECRCRWWAF